MNQPIRTEISSGDELRRNILSGVNKLADPVIATLGARGRNIALPKPYGPAHLTKDGVSVAREVYLEDIKEDTWAQLVKQVAIKTNLDAGDGTTTSTLLAKAIINEGIKHITDGSNPIEIKSGIDRAVKEVVAYLEKVAIPIGHDSDQIINVATISANGDSEIGKIIAEAFLKVGKEGHIEVEESKTADTYLETVEGFEVESGWVTTSPLFITNMQKGTIEFENPYIYISDKKLSGWHQIEGILAMVMKQKRPIVFIGSEIEGEALGTLLANADPSRVNQGKQRLPFAAIKAPKFGKERSDMLEDIAIMTGGTIVSDTRGTSFDKMDLSKLGQCDKIVISRTKTNIIKGAGSEGVLDNRRVELRGAIENEKDDTLKEIYKNRLGKLNGSIAIMYVGASSSSEVKEKKDRIEDAINATRAAVEEGIVPGGGTALFEASNRIDFSSGNRNEKIGMEIVRVAMEAPLRQILKNAGYDRNIVSKCYSLRKRTKLDDIVSVIRKKGFGYDVREERYCNMVGEGIIDPKKVTRVALENAAGVAGLILTTEGALTYKYEQAND